MSDDLAAFLDVAEARAAAAFAPCGVPGHTGHGLECRIEKGWPYNLAPVHEAIALAADVPVLVAMVRAVLALPERNPHDAPDDATYHWRMGRNDGLEDARDALHSALPPTPTAEETP